MLPRKTSSKNEKQKRREKKNPDQTKRRYTGFKLKGGGGGTEKDI